ncbi:bifunctional folylpolyglutamate synthase/dihydrofolate synthase [Alicyclobacillus tolerans]|uniref:bifunctional folylpolyglutamate synthase/dihydrofolate synthase n=1 Tax=Alicyclobacillus tolerans TaxID=90970 RepID=UPI001F432A92|nr:folylpolyglutamate synthase/dihydrofolate synthase family protein [Alicyclobacillus tolerans]MCF8563544.1 bifunctional folylpolyglutamate synthase/dihydrofolate synthase [Alicyclobacillus tolerans]
MAVTHQEGLLWLKSLGALGMKPGLERMSLVLKELGNPHEPLRFFHVAGTNGKGSVCAFLDAVLSTVLKVGVFTSPAFDGYRGRFSVNGDRVSEADFASLAAQVQAAAQAALPRDSLTEFEALTVMAILHFYQERVDAVVWETGLGGRHDSTNIVRPVVAAITNVSYDHMEVLGRTIAEIAFEKAGIIKPGIPVITAAKDEAYAVIQAAAMEQQAPVWRCGTHFNSTGRVENLRQTMTYRGLQQDVFGLPVPLFGRHQYENAAIAVAMYEAAHEQGICRKLTDDELRASLAQVVWPGRFEVFWKDNFPLVLDGAHNPDGAMHFALALHEFSRLHGLDEADWTMVIGVLADKDVQRMLNWVLPLAGRVIVAAPHVSRAKPAHHLANDIKGHRPELRVSVASSVQEAVEMGIRHAKPVACWGSLYTVDEARQAMVQMTEEFSK